MKLKLCPRCQKEKPNVGPWKSGEWSELCGSCKIQLTLTPKRVAALQAEFAQVGRYLEKLDAAEACGAKKS